MAITAAPRSLLAYDATPNNSDKTFTVASGKQWHIDTIYVLLVSTATAGNRWLLIDVDDGANIVLSWLPVASVQAASITGRYALSPVFPRPAAEAFGAPVSATFFQGPLPMLYLPQGYRIRIRDGSAIAPAADAMTIAILGSMYGGE